MPPANYMYSTSRRRNGKPASCEPCRRDKVRCDHALPICTRCRDRGLAPRCYYHPAPLTRPKGRRIFPLAEGVPFDRPPSARCVNCKFTFLISFQPTLSCQSITAANALLATEYIHTYIHTYQSLMISVSQEPSFKWDITQPRRIYCGTRELYWAHSPYPTTAFWVLRPHELRIPSNRGCRLGVGRSGPGPGDRIFPESPATILGPQDLRNSFDTQRFYQS